MTRSFVLIANPENRRVAFFREACSHLGLPEPRILPWSEVLHDDFPLDECLSHTGGLRIESPGENFDVERQLIQLGSTAAQAENLWPWISADESEQLEDHPGRVRLQRQWYHGWSAALAKVDSAARRCGVEIMNLPSEIALAFDKAATQSRLAEAGVPVAPNLGICRNFEELHTKMHERRMHRVFLKPCHSSSASGVVALASDGGERWLATSSAIWSAPGQLHNSLRLQTLHDMPSIRCLVDAVCQERALAERWIPKASIGGRAYDLRVLVIGGQAAHVVVRTSHSPLTNLHLGNARGDPDAVRTQLGNTRWQAAMNTAENAAACFPGCLYLAVDLMVDSSLRRFVVAEVNAFGDLLPNVLWNGWTPCEAELRAWLEEE